MGLGRSADFLHSGTPLLYTLSADITRGHIIFFNSHPDPDVFTGGIGYSVSSEKLFTKKLINSYTKVMFSRQT